LNIYIFTIQDFWATCACPENRVCPEIFQCIEYIYFFWKFSRQVGAAAPPTTRFVRLWLQLMAVIENVPPNITKQHEMCQEMFFFIILATAISGIPAPEICFLPGQ